MDLKYLNLRQIPDLSKTCRNTAELKHKSKTILLEIKILILLPVF